MLIAPIPENEAERLKSLEDMDILSTAREGDLDRITRLAQQFFDIEIALISLIDKDRQWFKSRVGLDATETGRDISFCGHAIMEDRVLLVENALEDSRFADNPLVTGGPEIRFYAGHPLTNAEGFRIGTLCMISPEARKFSLGDQDALKDFARLAELVMENRSLSETQAALLKKLKNAERDNLIDPLTGLWNMQGFDLFYERESERTYDEDKSFAVGLINLDQAQQVKEEFGDELLEEVIKHGASVLVSATQVYDTVAKFDDTTFIIIIPDVLETDLNKTAQKIVRTFKENDKFTLSNGESAFGASVGITFVSSSLKAADLKASVLNQAQSALHQAIEKGGTQAVINNMDDQVLKSLSLS
ncbi:diguanylate cyclase [Terasakiella sp. A23]|uniref:GGDEF domain-containing protein n=1 Tax=Terasakiella sp. FCG-A23 TaxID=3080561 RepID=UPI002954589A|nr:diguanylate cyclase [Terasakiella sp. A23]MDV7340188.1 diguanylate cyclase [Terasakiella sp. A23]